MALREYLIFFFYPPRLPNAFKRKIQVPLLPLSLLSLFLAQLRYQLGFVPARSFLRVYLSLLPFAFGL
ncbi:MAG: hypothetical protein QF408_15320, partial [Pirellulales bacterium]|nr:hypothetical protein [Pirellulales bacterium]